MGCLYFILAGVMALFGVLGYLYGATAAILTLVFVGIGLFIVSRFGTTLINIINKFWQLFLSGGVQAFVSGGDLAQVRAKMATIPPLIPSDAAGAFLLLLLVVLIVLAILLGRFPRFRRPPSLGGLLIGLLNGYLVGGYLLALMFPSFASSIWLPFGLASTISATAPPLGSGNPWDQFVATVLNASARSLALIVGFIVAVIILVALLNTVGRGRSRRTGGGAGGGTGGGGGGGGR